MRFSRLEHYIEAVESLSKRLRIEGSLAVERDALKQLSYKVNNGVVCFDLKGDQGLYLFLNGAAHERFMKKNPKANLVVGGLYVSVNEHDGFWADYVVGGRPRNTSKPCEDAEQRGFYENRKAVCNNNKWGFIDTNNNLIIKHIWDDVEDFCESRTVVCKDGFYGLIDTDGNIIINVQYDELSWDGSSYCYGEKMGRWGVYDRLGRVVVNFEWDWVGEFSHGYAIVERNGKCGFVDKFGKLTISPKYDQATSFDSTGFASVSLGDKQFFIDTLDRRG